MLMIPLLKTFMIVMMTATIITLMIEPTCVSVNKRRQATHIIRFACSIQNYFSTRTTVASIVWTAI
jgi:hypothetical protein